MKIRLQKVLRGAASWVPAVALLVSSSVVSATDTKSAFFEAASAYYAKWVAERLAAEGLTIQVFVPENGIGGIPAGALVNPTLKEVRGFDAMGLHLEAVPALLPKEDLNDIGSKYILTALKHMASPDHTTPTSLNRSLAALPAKFVMEDGIPLGSELHYTSIPALVSGDMGISDGTRFHLAAVPAAVVEDGETVTINGIPLTGQSAEEMAAVVASWYASALPQSVPPLNPLSVESTDCLDGEADSSSCLSETPSHSVSHDELGTWYKGKEVGRRPTKFWQPRSM